ncbi:S-adenosyl-L-methionine-dependent methyltransferase [Mycena olivaceomarginata]|nr:S-adenosyl-L-methionine-dependent methyltransferase [Mycena olivaceomarginata]
MKPDYSKFSADDTTKMEETSGVLAKAMLVQSGLLPMPPKGGGSVTSHLFSALGKTTDVRVVCADLEESMMNSAAERIKKNRWNAEAILADAQALPFPDNHFSHNLMNMGIQVIPDPGLVMKESFRVLKSGGKLGMTMSTSPGWLDTFQKRQCAIEGFTLPPAFTGPFSSGNPSPGFIKVEHTDNMGRYLKFVGEVAKDTLQGEVGEKYAAYMRKRYGDGDFTLTSEAFVITAEKP